MTSLHFFFIEPQYWYLVLYFSTFTSRFLNYLSTLKLDIIYGCLLNRYQNSKISAILEDATNTPQYGQNKINKTLNTRPKITKAIRAILFDAQCLVSTTISPLMNIYAVVKSDNLKINTMEGLAD